MPELDIQVSVEDAGWLEEAVLEALCERVLGAAARYLAENEDQPFPAYPIAPGDQPGPMLGDIAIARETVEREAIALEKSFDEHLTHLLVHGFLHLFGYDHMTAEEAEEMEGLETRILASLGLSDPYAGQVPV